jgi:hypothetical protein
MERTGIPALDALLAEYADWAPVARMRDPERADGSCELVATHLVDKLRERGFDRPGLEAYLSGDEWEGDEMVLERISPDDFGYQDRPLAGNNSHVVCLIDAGDCLYSVDFTASQYGYREFPLVQRLKGGVWEREWKLPELAPLETSSTTAVLSPAGSPSLND